MNKYKLSLSSSDFATANMPILLVGDVVDNLKEASALGYDGLEVHIRETAELDYSAIRNAICEYGVKIASIATGKLNTLGKVDLMDLRPYISRTCVESMSRYIRIASKLETNLIIGWVRGNLPESGDPTPHLNELARNLNTVCAEAAKNEVKVFLEVVNRYETNIFTTCHETIDFLAHYEISNCFIHLDSFHMNIDETDPVAAIRLAGNRLGYFHVADNSRLWPGSGTINFKSELDALSEIGYDGYVSVECFPGNNGHESAKRAISYLRSLE